MISAKIIASLFMVIVALQCATTLALPTRVGYGKMARRSNYPSRKPSPTWASKKHRASASSLRWASVSGSRQWNGANPTGSIEAGAEQVIDPTPFPTTVSVATPTGVATIFIASDGVTSAIVTLSPATTGMATPSGQLDMGNAQIGNEQLSTIDDIYASAWVPATNIALPGSGSSLRERMYYERAIVQRAHHTTVVPMTATFTVNIGKARKTVSMHTTPAVSTIAATTSIKVVTPKPNTAAPAIEVAPMAANVDAMDMDDSAVIQTLTFTDIIGNTQTATVTLTPSATTSSDGSVQTAYLPIAAESDGMAIEMTLSVNATVGFDDASGSDASVNVSSRKRSTVNTSDNLQKLAAANSLLIAREEMLSERWEDCEIGTPDCFELPNQ